MTIQMTSMRFSLTMITVKPESAMMDGNMIIRMTAIIVILLSILDLVNPYLKTFSKNL